ncbi:G-type lectin S-receptor-like serine/threonine-protein kinase At4g27290 [Cajanus cajan]|nr:G-type lectin S-receptor-like serine/threonine-protein kinase At4g27290 [Cajanus cajan]
MTMFSITFAIIKLVFFLFSYSHISNAIDTITQLHPLADDGSTLVSMDGTFELGFFSLGLSPNRYVGIWYKNIPVRTVVWVANRDTPIQSNSSKLSINKDGNLVLLSHNNTIVWSTKTSTKTLSPIVQLLGTGNLVLRDESDSNPMNYLWQSFDHPSDTLLPGMKLGWNLKSGFSTRVSAWKNWDDPSTGDFTWRVELEGYPQMMMWKGTAEYYRGGPWNGLGFSSAPELEMDPPYVVNFVSNNDEVYYTYNLKNKSSISRVVMNQTVYARQRYIWIEEAQSWRLYTSVPREQCDYYKHCGSYGKCDMDEFPTCKCLLGFRPKSPQEWDTMDWSKGCVQSQSWKCREKNKDGFLKFSSLKLPDTKRTWVNASMRLEECKAKCWGNCACKAYANLDIRGGGSGCVIWFGDLLDLKYVPDVGQDLYVRLAITEIANHDQKDEFRERKAVITSTIPLIIMIIFLTISYFHWRSRRKIRECTSTKEKNDDGQEDLELPSFGFALIARATDNFSNDKKLGEGGFGPVYRGMLPNGQEIAVKRLSQRSCQGLKELKNEVIFCGKLQHRNVVKVLGCCIHGEERLLIYEFMPKRSLDSFLFDSSKGKFLNWSRRFQIISGIARGILYLHQDSRLRIIHRDLKSSNILLDNELNPKISDFGLAQICGDGEIEGNTSRIVGTHGYMAPEYAIHGLFSTKSDVFSFGILLLEIVSGKKNQGILYPYRDFSLIGHAWRLWREGIPMEFIDDCLKESCTESEAIRCIHIGLLCVQHYPYDRPDITSVVMMLSNNENALPCPKEPGFLLEKFSTERVSSFGPQSSSINETSISMLEPR